MDYILEQICPISKYKIPFIKKIIDDIICAVASTESDNI